MKNRRLNITILSLCVIAGTITGCKMFGANPAPPSKTEQKLFDIETNVVPQIVTRTNTVTTTNVVNIPSPTGVPMFSTNFVTATNIVTQTNQVENYQYTPKAAIESTINAVGTASGPFTAGIGTLVGGGIALLYGLWGQLRSNKKGNTNLALTQEIEAIRSYILTLPQGTKIDSAVTQFMQQHQVEAGVAHEVLGLIDGYSGNPTVTGIAQALQTAINDVTAPTPPAAPKT